MNILDAVLNAVAVWFVLKAVEVTPFAIYDLSAFFKHCFSKAERDEAEIKQPFDASRGKLEFVVSGAGFLQFSLRRRCKKLFLISSLVPILIFILEILSIFLGDETRTCQTSQDASVVKVPVLEIFGEGNREVNATDLRAETVLRAPFIRFCLEKHSNLLGVEYLATVCSDLETAAGVFATADALFPENKGMSVVLQRSEESSQSALPLTVLSLPFKNSLRDFKIVGILPITSSIVVNGKTTLANDATKGYLMDDTMSEQIIDDVKALEKAENVTPSEVIVESELIIFSWADKDDFTNGVTLVLHAIMSQSRTVVKTASEMSVLNDRSLRLEGVDISCQEDFFLPRTASIAIILTGIVLRLALLALPASISSAEYSLLGFQTRDEFSKSALADVTEEQSEKAGYTSVVTTV